jgi:hypothetical protein
MSLLKSHIDAVERSLLATSQIPANAGHPLHKGTPRETFISGFLRDHLSERVAIGTGEIIDAESKPKGRRNQLDIVIHRRDYPRLHFGGDVYAFLAESVVATIEVKSKLDRSDIEQSIKAARTIKGLKRSLSTGFAFGYIPPGILSYVVAYDGPSDIHTVCDWVQETHRAEAIEMPRMHPMAKENLRTPSPSIDGVFILGKGFLYFNNVPLGFSPPDLSQYGLTDAHIAELETRLLSQHPEQAEEIKRMVKREFSWVAAQSPTGNLLLLFLFLTMAVSGMAGSVLNPEPYLKGADWPLPRLGFLP